MTRHHAAFRRRRQVPVQTRRPNRPHQALHRTALRLELLEPRQLLAGEAIHDLFAREVFPAGGAYDDMVVGDWNRDGRPDVAVANGEATGAISVLLGDGAGHFSARTTHAVGKYPLTIVTADFNGDGILDLAAANVGSYSGGYERTVSILIGRGDGTFNPPTKLDTGGRPRSIAIADFTGDGVSDILTVNSDDVSLGNSYSLLAGRGDGTFSTRVDARLNFSPEDVAVGDLNGDGKKDLAVAHSQAITVLLGQGNGTFGAGADYAVTAAGYSKVELADMNRDGSLDVVATGEYPGSVSVLLGSGDGTLGSKVEYSTVPRPRCLAVTDVNADSIPDVITGSWQDGYVGVRLGRGDGTLGAHVEYWSGGSVSSVVVADFNADGLADIASDNSGDYYVAVLPGVGGGRFDAPRTLQPTSAWPTAMASADLNGDSVLDLVTLDTSSRVASVLLGAGGAAFAPQVDYPVTFSAQAIRLADFNADGRADLLVTNNYQTVAVRLNLGDGTFGPAVDYTVSLDGSSALLPAFVADVNRDGRADVIVSDTGASKLFVLYGRGDGTFTAAATLIEQADPLTAVADFNRDGSIDLVTGQFPTQTVYMGRGDGTFDMPTRYSLGSEGHPTQLVATGDVNGDGNPDLVVTGGLYNGSDRDLWVQLGRGDGAFAAPSMVVLPIAERPAVLKLADVNADGRDEIITDRGGTRVAVLAVDASGAFRLDSEYDLGDTLRDVAVADFSGDGAADIAAVSPARAGVAVLAGHGDGTFADDFEYGQSGSPSSVAVGDLNGDGSTDIICANGDGHTASVRLGVGNGAFGPAIEYHVGPNPGDMTLADFNRDGILDLVVAHRDLDSNRPHQFDSVSVALGVGDGSFGAPTELFVQGVPVAVRAADVNGDGALDIVTANARSSPFFDSVSVLLGNGDGTFQVDRNYLAGDADPKDLAVGDLNGDGYADVVSVAGTDTTGTAAVLLGRADGSLDKPVKLALGRGARTVAIADLNGDGKMDVVTGNSPSYLNPGSSFSVLLGRGDGTFETRVDHAVDGSPQRIALADMDGDGHLDVVASNGTGGTFSVWLGGGDGTFTATDAASFAIGNNSNLVSLGIADFDKDGKFDLALADADRSGILVALQGGNVQRTGFVAPATPLPADNAPGVVSPHPVSWTYTGPTVSGTISTNTTWSGVIVVSGQVTVAAGATLTVQPGTIVKFKDGAGAYGPVAGQIEFNGTLRILGTAAQPVIFTSLADDSAGGDTNGDGAATGPNAGDWGPLKFHATAGASSLAYAEVRYAGDWWSAAVQIDGGSPTFTHVTIRDAMTRGLAIGGTAGGTFSGLTVERTGGSAIEAGGSLATSFTDVKIDATGLALGMGSTGDNGILATGSTTSIRNAQFSHVPGWAIDIPMTIWPNVSGLVIDTATTGHAGAVNVTGTLAADCAPAADVTWCVYGTVDAGVTLTLAPGTVLKGGLTLLGTLDARGTADRPIIVTATGDDSAGGDTNDDGNASHPRESISGPRLRFYDTGASGSVLEYVEVRYGGGANWLGSPYAAVEIEKASPRLSNVTLRDTDNWALLLKQGAAPTVERLTVENCIGAGSSDGYGVYVKSDAGAFTLSDVSFSRVTNWPLYLESIAHWGRVSDIAIDAMTCSRGNSAYVAGGTLIADVRPVGGIAWQIANLTVPAGRTLTLDPGTVIKSTGVIEVSGILAAHGTPAAPVVFTVPTDDSAGGDTDADGGASSPAAGGSPWLAALSGGSLDLQSVEVRYRGVNVASATAALAASKVLHAPQEAARVDATAPAAAALTVTSSLLVKDSADTYVVFGSGSGAHVTLVNDTIVGGAIGVVLDQNARLDRLVNNVVASCATAGVGLSHGGTASGDVRNNDVYNPGATLGNYMNMQDYTGLLGNISANPRFVDSAGGDYRPGDHSPLIDAATGDDAPLTDIAGMPRFDDWGVPNTGSGSPLYADMGCCERISDSTSPIDLVVVADSITGPESTVPDETVTVHWTIQNVGTEAAVGPWHDQVALVRTPDESPVVIAAGEFLVGEGVTLQPGETFAASAEVNVPQTATGEYFWQVQTNSRLDVCEGINRLNNTTHGAVPVQVAVPELQLGMPASGVLSAEGDARVYAVRVTAGQSVIVTLDDADDQGANELYVRFGEVPTRSDYDRHSVLGATADRRLQFTASQSGYAYVLVYGRTVPAVPAAFQITASLAQFSIDAITQASGGNVGRVTTAILGSAIPDDATPYLRGPDGQEIWAWPIQRADSTEVYATFDLTGQQPGLYDLVMNRAGADVAMLTQAFEVRPGAGPRLETSVIAPDEVRRGWIFPVTIEWANTGDTDMASPLLKLSNPAGLEFSVDPFLESTLGSDIEFVGYSATGPAGVLQPGDRESVTLWALASAWVSRYDFTLSAVTEEWNNPQPATIDWAAMEPLYRPPAVADDAEWAAVWQLFTQDLGDTWTDVVRRLADEVTHTGLSDGSLPLVNDLMQDALARAAGWSGQTTADAPLYVETGTPVQTASGAVEAVQLTFNQSVDPATFTADDVRMTDPDGNPLSVTLTRESSRLWRVDFQSPVAAGFYSLLIGPDIATPRGGKLDQDQDGQTGETTDDRYEAGFLLESPASSASSRDVVVAAESAPAVLSDKFIVTSYSPTGTQRTSTLKCNYFIINFSRPVDESTLTLQRIQTVRDQSGTGTMRFTRVTRLSPTQYRLDLAPTLDAANRDKSRAELNGPFVVGLAPGVRDTTGQELELGPPYIRFDALDDVPPQIVNVWVGLPASTGWQAAFETSIIDAEAATLLPGARALPMGSSLPGPVDHIYLRLNEAIAVSTLTPSCFTITDPDGQPAAVLAVEEVKSTHDNGTATWEVVEGYRIVFAPQTKEGKYTVRIAPEITDPAGNKLDGSDEDRTGGEPEDAYEGTFEIVPVQVFGSADLGADVLTTQSTDGFGVALWEKVGQLDPVPGVPEAGDAPDYLVSLTNDLTGTRYTWIGDTYAFTRDLAGQPIVNQDPQEGNAPRELYVTLLGQHARGAFIDASTITTTDHSNDPMWVKLHPEPLAEGKHQEWARLKIFGRSDVKSYPAGQAGGPLAIDIRADQLVAYPFRVLSWLSAVANTVETSMHIDARTPIYLSTVVAAPYTEDSYDAARNMILVPSHLLNDPLSFWHAYAHALQSAARGYRDVPQNPQDSGAIWESNSEATAFCEGVATWLASWLSGQVEPPPYQPSPLSQFRLPKYLRQNDYWMGFDGYGFATNAAAADTKISPSKLRSDGINDNANTGDNVAGGIATLLWNLGPEFFPAALDKLTAAEFYAAVAGDSRAAPAFVDQGLAVIDDMFEPNDLMAAATVLPEGTTLVDNLVMAEAEAGRGDWFRLRVPAGKATKTYALTVRIRFNGKQGDLDLVVRTADGKLVKTDTARGGDSALVHLTGLDGSKSYDFLIGAFGHGALLGSGNPSSWGGDFSPYYTLQIAYPGNILPYLPLSTASTNSFQAWDPNEKSGPAGAGTSHYLPESAILPYTICFENDPDKATVPAQRVLITDRLDANLDWSTFQFGAIHFGDCTIPVPDPVGRLRFETDVTVAYDDYPVHVVADFNPETGLLSWEFASYDPATGMAPHDALAGFLPPNDATRHGEGFVTYTIKANDGLATGSEILNQASIVFDVNPEIVTNQTLNTIDAQAPSSHVLPLPGSVDSTSFTVSWQGIDDADGKSGSGIAGYDVYVSDNGGAFVAWLTGTTLTSATYAGQDGHTYAFYSLASDNVGHREVAPITADARTTVDAIPLAVTIDQAGSQADPARNGLVHFTVVFNKRVGDFAAEDIVLAGTAPGMKVEQVADSGDGKTFDVAISAIGRGMMTASIPAGAAHDTAGNASLASTGNDNTVAYLAWNANLPWLDVIPDQSVAEDSATKLIPLSGIAVGGGLQKPSLQVTVTSSNPKLIPTPKVSYRSPGATGSLSFKPVADQIGTSVITVTARDPGPDGKFKTADDRSFYQTFTVTVTPVNHRPSFKKGSNISVLEDSGRKQIVGWVSSKGVYLGPANESWQKATFALVVDKPELFSEQPTLDPLTGTLSFTPAQNAFGKATVTVTMNDHGGGQEVSLPQTFTIDVKPVNDKPSFNLAGDVTVAQDSGVASRLNWLTGFVSGPANEAAQKLASALITTNNPKLFARAPAIDAKTGTLTFTPAKGASGEATVTVRVKDNGGTGSGGIATSDPLTFTIRVTKAPVVMAQAELNDAALSAVLRNAGVIDPMMLQPTSISKRQASLMSDEAIRRMFAMM